MDFASVLLTAACISVPWLLLMGVISIEKKLIRIIELLEETNKEQVGVITKPLDFS